MRLLFALASPAHTRGLRWKRRAGSPILRSKNAELKPDRFPLADQRELALGQAPWNGRIIPINYRHAFHAGNFADVLKHAVLARVLVYLTRKESPFRFIDTHAGAGRFDLMSQEAKRSPEWREGVARVLTASPPAPVAEFLRPYLEAVGPHDADGRPLSYPGSPAIAQTLMRAQDRIALCEANPEEREALIAALGRDGRLSIVGTDGYVALNAYLPPKERRGLVLIDPPFEAPNEAERRRAGSRTRFAQMADRNLRRLAPDPRSSSGRPFSQFDRRAGHAKHPATRTGHRLRASRRARPGAARARRPPRRQSAAYADRRGAGAHAMARANARPQTGRESISALG